MSEQNQNRNNRSGGQGGGNRNHNRNRNRSGGQGGGNNRNRNGGNGGNRNNSGGGGGNASQKRNELQPSRNRRPRQKPLTFWQKLLKAVGLYKDPNPPAKGDNQKGHPAKKSAKKSGRVPGGGRVNQGQGQGQGKKQNSKGGQQQRQRKKTPPPTKVETPRLYVGNLSYDATEYDLEELFKGVGAVRKVELVYNRHTHKSKGYGFVNMANMEEAERAVEVLHDQPFMGRKMIVNGARSKGPNDKSPGGDSDSADKEPTQEAKPAAAEIPTEEEVHSLAPDKE